MKNLINQLLRFGIVGIIATVVDVGTLVILKELVHLDVLIANAFAFITSVAVNYILSTVWVFESKKDNKIRQFIIFAAMSLGGLLINQITMWLGTEFTAIYYLFIKFFAMFLEAIYNFITRKLFLEKKSQAENYHE